MSTGKETVFARLNNRIRNLEMNISLSGEYLGELSLRYRKQMDDMQKALNKSNAALAQYTKSTDEKLAQYRFEIEILQTELDRVKAILVEHKAERDMDDMEDFDSMSNETTLVVDIEKTLSKVEVWAPLIAAVEIIALVGMVWYCCRGRFGTDERALEAMVEGRVRQAIVDELKKLGRNGMAVNAFHFGSPTGNGHLPNGRTSGASDHAEA